MYGRAGTGPIAASLVLVSCLAGDATADAEIRNDIIGSNEYYKVKEGDTLLEIARLHDLGFIELVTANPGIDPWIPEPDRTILLPSEHILPDAPQRGIVINRPELRLYYFDDETGTIVTYPIGVGRQGRETPLEQPRSPQNVKALPGHRPHRFAPNAPSCRRLCRPAPKTPSGFSP